MAARTTDFADGSPNRRLGARRKQNPRLPRALAYKKLARWFIMQRLCWPLFVVGHGTQVALPVHTLTEREGRYWHR